MMQREKSLKVILALVIFICGTVKVASSANMADYYPLTLGSWWEYEIYRPVTVSDGISFESTGEKYRVTVFEALDYDGHKAVKIGTDPYNYVVAQNEGHAIHIYENVRNGVERDLGDISAGEITDGMLLGSPGAGLFAREWNRLPKNSYDIRPWEQLPELLLIAGFSSDFGRNAQNDIISLNLPGVFPFLNLFAVADLEWWAPSIGMVVKLDFAANEGTIEQKSVLIDYYIAPPNPALVRGKVVDRATGEAISGVTLAFTPGSFSLTTNLNGSFFSATAPTGIYGLRIFAEGYETRLLHKVRITAGVTNDLSTALSPRAPTVSVSALEGFNDGVLPILIAAQVTHPDGIQNIASVSANLSELGGNSVQSLYDDGTHGDRVAGDGTYSCEIVLDRQIRAHRYPLIVVVRDKRGRTGLGALPLDVVQKIVSAIAPAASDLQRFINDIRGQTLRISLRITSLHPMAAAETTNEEACVTLMVYDPSGELYGTYPVEGSLDLTIPAAASGEWTFETINQCDTTLNYQIETRGAGTGLITGRVVDSFTGTGLSGASVTSNTGGMTQTLDQGYFASVAVAGTGAVVTTLKGYQQNVRAPVTITAGSTTTLNIQVIPEDRASQASPAASNTYEILDPAEEPRSPNQPFAAKVTTQDVEFAMVFPPYEQPVDLYVGFTIDYPGLSGRLFLFNQNGEMEEYTESLIAWRKGVTQSQSDRILTLFPSSGMPPAKYTLYALVTPSSSAFTYFDLIYFTATFAQPPPQGQSVAFIENPAEDTTPLTQPLAVKASDGNLVLNAHFPPQQQPVSIYLGYITPGGELLLIKEDNTSEPFTTTLWPWRKDVTDAQSSQIFSTPFSQFEEGSYGFYSLVTTDPLTFADYQLTFFNMYMSGME